jgi:hypothetical protein
MYILEMTIVFIKTHFVYFFKKKNFFKKFGFMKSIIFPVEYFLFINGGGRICMPTLIVSGTATDTYC